MKVVILAGGFGTRISEFTNLIPKPMIKIGDKPILWHIMNAYAKQNHKEFFLSLGYKGEVIKEYFLNYKKLNSDFSMDLKSGELDYFSTPSVDWKVNLIDTGLNTMTGGRIKRLKEYIGNETFMVTYGDGLANINFTNLIDFHNQQRNLVTLTAVRPPARFGRLEITDDNVYKFIEKPQLLNGWINGGFFVMEPEIFDYIENDFTMLEREPLENIAKKGQLRAFKHEGFWQCMDSKRDHEVMETFWKQGAPWLDVEGIKI